jgi:hypothetical protein
MAAPALPLVARAERLIDLWHEPGWEPIVVTADAQGRPLLLELQERPDATVGSLRYTLARAKAPQRYRIRHVRPDATALIDLPETTEHFHHVQALGPGRYLVARGCAEGEGDRNAHVFDATGALLSSFFVGDAVEDVQAAGSNRIWVSYFDAGPDRALHGLVGFDASGQVVFHPDRAKLPEFTDCFAMNVVGPDQLWLYTAPGYSLTRVQGGEASVLTQAFPLQGSTGFAIAASRGLFAGGHDAPGKVFHVSLESFEARQVKVTDAEGEPLDSLRTFGRGSRLFLATRTALYALDLENVQA